jgi:hypothetical protein
MTAVIFMFVAIAIVGTIVLLLDWWARRKDQQSRGRPTA